MIVLSVNTTAITYKSKEIDDECNNNISFSLSSEAVSNVGRELVSNKEIFQCIDSSNMKMTQCEMQSYDLAFILIKSYLEHMNNCSWDTFKDAAQAMFLGCVVKSILYQVSLNECVADISEKYFLLKEDCYDDVFSINIDFSGVTTEIKSIAPFVNQAELVQSQEINCPIFTTFTYLEI